MLDLDRFWDEEETTASGVTKAQIAAWQTRHGAALPKLLKKVLSQHNGGYVRETRFRVFPLDEIGPADGEFWELASIENEDEVADKALLFPFAWDEELGGQYILNFNAAGLQDDPSVMQIYSDPGELRRVSKSLKKFFFKMLCVSDTPVFDWTELETLTVITDETLDDSYWQGPGAHTRNVLARDGNDLVLYVYQKGEEEERMEKTRLPRPLAKQAHPIRNRHDNQKGPWTLHLEPRESDGITQWESVRTRSGQWKNAESHGVPIYVLYESWDKQRLVDLQAQLQQASDLL